jgi:hypothetical protein
MRKPQSPSKLKPDLKITPAASNQTEKVVIFLTRQLTDIIGAKAEDMFGKRKGNVSLYMEQAMRVHLHMNVEGVSER